MIRSSDLFPSTLAVCGDPVVGWALVLLLQEPHYDVKFLPISSSNEPGVLEGVQLLLLAPMPELSIGYHEALLASLRDEAAAAKIPILELVVSPEKTRGGKAQDNRFVQAVPWPCRIEELKRRVEAVLLATTSRASRTAARQGPRT
jgi:hypothetical protein